MSSSSQLNFLLVDQDDSSREAVKKYLLELQKLQQPTHALNFTFQEGKRIKAAVELFNSYTIHCIICDWELPVASGFTFLKLIKSQGRFQKTVFIMTSSPTPEEQVRAAQAIQLKVDAFLIKPFRMEKLRDILVKKSLIAL